MGLILPHFRLKSAFSFALRFKLLTQIMHSYLTLLLRSPLARAPYVNLKPLIEGGNLQVYIYMYCVHARKRALGAPRTHFRACKISRFPGGMPPDPHHTIYFVGPHFLHLPWAPPTLSAALIGVIYSRHIIIMTTTKDLCFPYLDFLIIPQNFSILSSTRASCCIFVVTLPANVSNTTQH